MRGNGYTLRVRKFTPVLIFVLLVIAVAAATVFVQSRREQRRQEEIRRILTASETETAGSPPAAIAPTPVPPSSVVPKTTSTQSSAGFSPVAVARIETPAAWSNDPAIASMRRSIVTGRIVDAEQGLSRSTATDPITLYYRGVFAAWQGKRAEAVAALTSARADARVAPYADTMLEVYPLFDTFQDGPSTLLDTLISRALLQNGEVEIARDKLQFVVSQDAEYGDAHMLLGAAELLLNHADRAELSLRKTIPTSKPDAYYWLGLATSAQKKYAEASAFFRSAIDRGIEPESRAREKLAENQFLNGDVEASAASYELALASCAEESGCPRTEMTVRPVWIYLEFLKEPLKGLSLARRALAAEPENAMAANLVAWSLIRLQRYDEARTYVTQALALDATLPAAHLNSGTLAWLNGDLVSAKRSFLRASQLDSTGSVGRQALRNLEAIEALERAASPSGA